MVQQTVQLHHPASMTLSIRRALGLMTFALGLMPWVSFGLNSFDSQPYTLLVGFAYICASRTLRITPPIIAICLLLVFGVCIAVLINPPSSVFLTLRGVYGYLTFAVALVVGYDFICRYGIPLKVITYVNYAYLFFAFLDLVAPEISASISASRTTIGRGVTSLAAEPSFFAIYLFFSSWIVLIARDYQVNRPTAILLGANLFALVFLAQSALGVLLLLTMSVFVLFYLIRKLRLKTLLMICVALALGATLFGNLFQALVGSRLGQIFNIVTSAAGIEFFLSDPSANSRLQSIIVPVLAAFGQFPIPGGFETFGQQSESQRDVFGGLFMWRGGEEGNRISSWTGAMMYELGIFGIAILFIVAFARTKLRVLFLLERLLLLSVAIHAIPTNFPPIAFLLVFMFRPWATMRQDKPTTSDSPQRSVPSIANPR